MDSRALVSLGLLVLLLSSIPHTQASSVDQDWCGTPFRPEDILLMLDRQARGIYNPPATEVGVPHDTALAFHIVRNSAGQGGLSPSVLPTIVNNLNVHFAAAGILFCDPHPIDYIDNSPFYTAIDTQAEIDALKSTNVVAGAINIYFTETLANESGALYGQSSFTTTAVQGIVIDNQATPATGNHSTVSHEVGHYFDLYHTHETAFGIECTTGTNCAISGDLLCDTPADPTLGGDNVDANCKYISGSDLPPCGGTTPYAPKVNNLMSYAPGPPDPGVFTDCKTEFTDLQEMRALATLLNLRPELMEGCAPACAAIKLMASDGAPDDRFGRSISMSDNTVLVGAINDDDAGSNSGSAYIFQNQGSSWVQTAKLRATDAAPGDWFGYSASIMGDTALIGAPTDDDSGSNSGSAYIFEKQGSSWVQTAKLTSTDAAALDWFGYSVSLSGGTALIGAPFKGAGFAYVFEKQGLIWVERAKLTQPDGSSLTLDQFGASVCISGDTALVGAYASAPNGSAYIYNKQSSTWVQTAKLTASDALEFGFSVSLTADRALIGAVCQ